MGAFVVLFVLAVASLLAVMVLTAIGARRRGHRIPRAVVAGVFFPATWTAWYVADEHPFRR